MRILIVDDDDIASELVANALQHFGYEVVVAHSGQEALERMRSGLYRMVILDWEMTGMSGIEVCRHIRQRYSSNYVYIILLTGATRYEQHRRGPRAGADDFISKPFEPQELRVRIRTGERILSLISHEVTIFSMAKLTESRDQETGDHLERMREYCRVLAESLSQQPKFSDVVDGDYVRLIYMTSPLHDIGKVGIPDRVLLKPGPLTPEEFKVMKQHTVLGSNTLDAALRAYPEARFLCMARDIARSHHEWVDGTGYPDGLVGDDIPLCARIVGLADVYDALTSRRTYKPAFSHEKARRIILEETNTHFDADVVQAFLENEQQFLEIRQRFAGDEEMQASNIVENQLDLAMDFCRL